MITKQLIIEPEELAQAINDGLDDQICIVDLSSEANYLSGHIPGAVFLPFQSLMRGTPPAPGKIASKESLDRIFSYLGLSNTDSENKTHFIVYDDEGGGWAGRFIWTLDVIGHSAYSYLNGGLDAWKQAKLPLETTQNQRQATDISITVDTNQLVEIKDILAGLEQGDMQVLDARSPQEYRGERVNAAKAGHIPGAINCEWTSLMDPNRGLRIRSDAKELLHRLGIDGTKPIITHCQSHHRSGFTYLVGKSLGFDIKGYHGSWSEWGNHPDTPVEL